MLIFVSEKIGHYFWRRVYVNDMYIENSTDFFMFDHFVVIENNVQLIIYIQSNASVTFLLGLQTHAVSRR